MLHSSSCSGTSLADEFVQVLSIPITSLFGSRTATLNELDNLQGQLFVNNIFSCKVKQPVDKIYEHSVEALY